MSFYYIGTTAATVAFTTIIFPIELQSVVAPEEKGLILGLVASAALAVGIVANILSGVLSDHMTTSWGRRSPFVLIGAALAVPSILLTAFVPLSLFFVSLSYLLVLTTINFSSGSYQPLLVDIVPSFQRGGGAALQVVQSYIGSALGYGISGYLISAGNIRMALILLAATVAATTLISAYFVRPLDTIPALSDGIRIWNSLREFLRPAKIKGGLLVIMIAGLLVSVGSSSIQFFGVYYLETILHQSKPAEALATSGIIGLAVSTASNLAWFRLSNRFNRWKVVIVATVSAGCLNLIFPFVGQYPSFVLLSSIFGASLGLFWSASIALASMLVPEGESGKYMAYYNLPSGVGTAISPLVGGVVLSLSGGASSFAGFVSLFIVTSLFLFASTVSVVGRRVGSHPDGRTFAEER
jgi:MFS family permease